MSVDAAVRAKTKLYEQTVVEYVSRQNGHILALSDDQPFLTLLRLTVQKELGLVQPGILTLVPTAGSLLKVANEACSRHPNPLLFIEQVMGGRDYSFLIQQLKGAYPGMKAIILTAGTQRERLMFLHEVGADNFIAKPISANTLIEKMAFTLKPQGKLGALVDAARQKIAEGEPDAALGLCDQILELKPGSAAGHLVQGDAYLAMQQVDRAREAYENASRNADLFLEPLRRLAELCASVGDLQGQLGYLQRLDALSPLNVDRKVDMGEIHLGLGDAEQAEALFKAAVTQMTKEAFNQISTVANRIADIYASRDPVAAERYLRASLETKGTMLTYEDIRTFNKLGISLRQQGRWQDAIVEYKKALNIAPRDENLFYNMGMAYAEGKDFANARANMVRALEINSEFLSGNAGIAYNIGAVFLQSDSRERAIVCFRRALETDPEHGPSKQVLARLG